jgi:hypothetical protein
MRSLIAAAAAVLALGLTACGGNPQAAASASAAVMDAHAVAACQQLASAASLAQDGGVPGWEASWAAAVVSLRPLSTLMDYYPGPFAVTLQQLIFPPAGDPLQNPPASTVDSFTAMCSALGVKGPVWPSQLTGA